MNKTNKRGDRRGLYTRTNTTIQKQRMRTLDRATAQYTRSCDSKVGKWLRLNDVDTYNQLLEFADDAAVER